MNDECPRCKNKNYRCFDERLEIFTYDDEPNNYVYLPVGYMYCPDCKSQWTEGDWHGATWRGRDEEEAFGWRD